MTILEVMLLGIDGYKMLLEPEVKVVKGGDNAISLQEVVIRFMKTL